MRGTSYRTIVNRYWRRGMGDITHDLRWYMRTQVNVRRCDKMYQQGYFWANGMWWVEVPVVQWADPWLNSTDRTG